MTRRRAHKAERLSEAAHAIATEGLAKGVAYDDIAARILAETGETIGASSLQRFYAAKFKPAREAKVQATVIADRLADRLCGLDDQQLQQAIKLRTAEALLPMLTELAADAPQHAAKFFADLDFNRVEFAKIEQRREEWQVRAELTAQKLEIERGKLARIREAAERALKKGGSSTPAAVRKAIADIYGISISDAQPGGGGSPPPSSGGTPESQIPPKASSAGPSGVDGPRPAAQSSSGSTTRRKAASAAPPNASTPTVGA